MSLINLKKCKIMSLKYMLIGTLLMIIGAWISVREWKQFKKELKGSKDTSVVLIKGFVDTFFLGGLGIAGIILQFIGLIFMGTGLQLW